MTLRLRYIQALKEQDERVTVFLTNGVKLNGQIKEIDINAAHDVESFVLDRTGHSQLVNMHAVATLLPEAPPNLKGRGKHDFMGA